MDPQIAELKEIVGRLDERLQAVHEDTTEIKKVIRDHIGNCDRRINSLERSRAIQRGAALALVGLATWVGWDYIEKLWRH